ncbi:hypothetical protein ES705_29415 [subsurface metagenome]
MKLVKDYMFSDITSVRENSSLGRVIKTMKLHRLMAIPVVDQNGNYVGCIASQDILNASVPEYMKSMYNTSFMANLDQIIIHLRGILNEEVIKFIDKSCPTVSPSDTMSFAADLLYRHKKSILPVVEGKNQVGWISKIEILSLSLNSDKE